MSELVPRERSALPLAALALICAGCIGNRIIHPVMPTGEELLRFQEAGPVPPVLDVEELSALHVGGSAYRVVPGDLLELQLPLVVTGVAAEPEETTILKARVLEGGEILLPMVGEVAVAGKTLSEVESDLVGSYHPDHLRDRPNIVVTVFAYRTASVAVMGAVLNPGIHQLRSDRLSVVGALMAAGGIHSDRGSGMIRVLRPGTDGRETIRLPVRGSNIPFADLELVGGETIVVEPQVPREMTVIGLVRRPGPYVYPEGRKYNLMQALAVAGGTDSTSAPRFATVYRKDAADEVIVATFRIDGTSLTDASNVLIKPGDVVAVEHTQGSWLRLFLSQVLGFRASISASSADQL